MPAHERPASCWFWLCSRQRAVVPFGGEARGRGTHSPLCAGLRPAGLSRVRVVDGVTRLRLRLRAQVVSGRPGCCTPSCAFCCCDVFRNRREMANVTCPVLMIHGREDQTVPFWHGEELYRSCPNPSPVGPLWVDHADHNNVVELAGATYFNTVSRFLMTIPLHTAWSHVRIN